MSLIPGLRQVQDFITDNDEIDLVLAIDASPWDTSMRRRVQHYGYRYDYRARTSSEYIGELPDWIVPLAQRVSAECPMDMPTQCIINEYQPGQGIGAHTDSDVFGPVVASVSLGDDVQMTFRTFGAEFTRVVCRRGLIVMSGEARTRWTHQIAPRLLDGTRARKRRLSLTFRTIA